MPVTQVLFKVGDRAFHKATQSFGTVIQVFHDGYEPRYYVRIGLVLWSIPQSALDSKITEFPHQQNQQVTEPKIVKTTGAGPDESA